MAFTAIDTDISGQGTLDLGVVANMLFWEVHLDTLGNLVRIPDLADPDRVLNAGWIAWGDHNSVIGGVDRVYWREPVWLNFVDQIHVVDFNDLGGTPPTFIASWFRWSLSPDTHGHIYGYAL